MNQPKTSWEDLVSATAGMEWPDQTPAALVLCSFRVDRAERLIHLLFQFDAALTNDELDDLSEVEGGILSHLPDEWQTRLKFQQISKGITPPPLPGGTIYRRGDVQTPLERWMSKQPISRG